jgi:hypothetical protein
MSWDGIYSKDRVYPTFNVGDEVVTDKSSWKGISSKTPYTVLKCFKKPGMVDTCKVMIIKLKTDIGYESEYATYHFKKTDRQLREDKINQIINK